MAAPRDTDAAIRRFSVVATVIIGVAIVGISYAADRADRRWSKVIDTLAGPRARVVHVRTGYRTQRANVSDVGELVNIVLDEVAQARARGSAG